MQHKTFLPVGVLTLALVAGACGRKDTEYDRARTNRAAGGEVVPAPAVPPVTAAPTTQTTRVADITGNPAQFLGKTVTVEADVDEVLSPYAFELDEDSPIAGGIDNDLVVAWPSSLGLTDLDNKWLRNKVRVTGVVGRYTVTELKREISRDLSAKLEAKVKNKPVLIATSVERLNRP